MVLEFITEIVALADLKSHPRNYRGHPDDQIEHLVESIKEHGLYRNIVVARDNTILAGHGVAIALRRMEWEEVAVKRLDLDPDDPRALKLLAGDNEIEHLAERDDRMLSEILKEINEYDVAGLLGTGYDEMMLANLVYVTRPMSEIKDFDAAAHWVGMPEFEPEMSDHPKLMVNFRTEEDRNVFLEKTGIVMSGQNSAWWPPKTEEDRKAFLFDG